MTDDGRVPLDDNSRSLSRDGNADACNRNGDQEMSDIRKDHSQRSNSSNRHRGLEERGRRENGGNEYGTTLYISNLPLETRTEDLRLQFEKFGAIDECRVISNPVSKESRGFAFLTFHDLKSSEDALSAMDGKDYDGKVLRVEKAKRSKPHDPTPGQYKGPTGASVKYDQRGRLKSGGNGRRSYDRHYESRSDTRPNDYHSYDRGEYRSVPDRQERYHTDPYASDLYYDDSYRRGSRGVPYDDGMDKRRDYRERPRSRSRDRRRERPRSVSPRRLPYRERSPPYERVRRR